MPAASKKPTLAPVLGPAQGIGVLRPRRLEPVRLPGALELPIDQIAADPRQPRQDWEHHDGEQRLADLADSIAEFGVLQPLLVRPAQVEEEGPPYWLVAGNRRFEAARRAGLSTVPVIVRDTDTVELRILQLTENLLRQDLAPLDEARAYQELMELESLSPRQLGTRLHISDQQVRLRLRLLSDQVLADGVERRQISANTARLIQQLPDEEQLPFRERVRLGERLQGNDLAPVRARLLAEGAIHPRRTRPPGGRVWDAATPVPTRDDTNPDHIETSALRDGPRAAVGDAGAADELNSEQRGQIVFESPSSSTGHTDSAVSLLEGGQIVFDPPTGLPGGIAGVLAAATPEARMQLGRVFRDEPDPRLDPHAVRAVLLLLADLVRELAREEPRVAELLDLVRNARHE